MTRQLAYSREETKRALDLCAFINGLPVMTFELKNSLTKQTVEDAIVVLLTGHLIQIILEIRGCSKWIPGGSQS